MRETLETVHEEESEISSTKPEAQNLVVNSAIPMVLKRQFFDIIQMLGSDVSKDSSMRAKQVLGLAEELNAVKRKYLDANEIKDELEINDLIYKIINIYTKIN